MDLAATLEDPGGGAARCSAGTSTSPPPIPSRRGCIGRSTARTCSRSSSTSSRPTPPTSPTSCCRRRASWSSTTRLSYFNLTLSAQVKAIEPLGEALPNQEIFRRLARAMGYTEPELFETDAAMLDALLAPGRRRRRLRGAEGERHGRAVAEPLMQFADGRFPTPSGKIEIASARAAAEGLPRMPLPHADPRPGGGPAAAAVAGLGLADEQQLRQRCRRTAGSSLPRARAASGRRRRARPGRRRHRRGWPTRQGELVMPVHVADKAPPGVALALKGAWPKLAPARATSTCSTPAARPTWARAPRSTASR